MAHLTFGRVEYSKAGPAMSTATNRPAALRRVLDQPGGNLALDLFVMSQHLGSLLDRAFAGTGVTPSQYAVYAQLARQSMTPGQVSAVLGLRPATLSGYLSAMERRGDLTRARHEIDGRSTWLALTPSGRERCGTCRQRMATAVRLLNAELGDAGEIDAMRAQLAHLDAALLGATTRIAEDA